MTDNTERVAEADLAGDVVKDGNSRDVCRIRSHVAVPSVQPKNTAQQKVSCHFHLIVQFRVNNVYLLFEFGAKVQ